MISKEDFATLPIGATIRHVPDQTVHVVKGYPAFPSDEPSVIVTNASSDGKDGRVWWHSLQTWEVCQVPPPAASTETSGGTKHDGGKPAFHLLDADAMSELSNTLDGGEVSTSVEQVRLFLDRFAMAADDATGRDLILALSRAWARAALLMCPSNPYLAMRLETAKVLDFGAVKYAPNNWRGGFKWSRLVAAAHRHLDAFARGTITDDETGLHHLAHFSCCMMFLVVHVRDSLGEDNRAEIWPVR